MEDRKRIVMDVDGTLCGSPSVKGDYLTAVPYPEVVERLRKYKAEGWVIIIQSARQMRTHANNVGRINATTLPTLIEWLRKHDVPFDEVHVGKPWCGYDGFYVDDRAIRPDEFLRLDHAGIQALIGGPTVEGQVPER
jgi:capsule biosynthesis phosphatase